MNPQKDPRIGTTIREYEILDMLGRGGMGEVYRARHVLLQEERAIKFIHSNLEEDNTFVERFIREAKILVKLHHPNLIHFYEFGVLEENTFFMVLELLIGETALERLRRVQKITAREAIPMIRQAALGLHLAHQKGIIHRDISPDNLLIVKEEGGSEITKVIDFGIAKPVGEETRMYTRNSRFLGKPEFCSPEQCGILEQGEVIDGRSDIYSLGITLYNLLSGKLPFSSPTAAGYLVKHVTEPPKPISSILLPEECPPGLDSLFAKALAKNRNDRFSSMEEFASALERLESDPRKLIPGLSVQKEAHISEMPPGHIFADRYRIKEIIHIGNRGFVYKAIRQESGETVALKIMNPAIMPPGKDRSRFIRGLQLAQKLVHPNICRIFEVVESGINVFVSMEFLEGNSVSEILQVQGRLRITRALPILKQVLLGLGEAHQRGVIHRNLKPQNIMIGPEGGVHLMDFATSISYSPEVQLISGTGEFVGTPAYMAPEQFHNVNIDHRADIYSMGILMFQIFTGRLPFQAEGLAALIFAHANVKPSPPSSVVPDFPANLEAIILKALEKNPENRYQSVSLLLADLQSVEDSARQFRDLFERGKAFYDRLQLQDALTAWRKALELYPQDAAVRKYIATAETRVHEERLVREELVSKLSRCTRLFSEKKSEEAMKILEECEKEVRGNPAFKDLLPQISNLRKS